MLYGYQYDIEYRSTDKQENADCLSRLPLNDHVRNKNDEIHEINRVQLESLPVLGEHVRKTTRADSILSRVLEYTLTGWQTEQADESIKPYINKRHEMTIEERCVLLGMRGIIAPPLRERVLDELHAGNQGIVCMKALSSIRMWWPGIDQNIASTVRSCLSCQSVRNKTPKAPLRPWDWPKTPWQRVNVHFTGPFMNKIFMVVVDSHLKWLEVGKLCDLFPRCGIPERLVMRNTGMLG